jgi:hypothetical protein
MLDNRWGKDTKLSIDLNGTMSTTHSPVDDSKKYTIFNIISKAICDGSINMKIFHITPVFASV